MKILSHYSHENILHIDCIDEVRKTIKISHAELQLWYNSEPYRMKPKGKDKSPIPMKYDFDITKENDLKLLTYIAKYYLPYKNTRFEKFWIKLAIAAAILGTIALIIRFSTFLNLI